MAKKNKNKCDYIKLKNFCTAKTVINKIKIYWMGENICKSYIWKELILKYIKKSWPSLESLQVTNVGKGMQKKEPSYTVSGNVS